MNITDSQLLDFLESEATPGLRWIARSSTTGRGYRLHQHDGLGSSTVRGAIMEALIKKIKQERKKAT